MKRDTPLSELMTTNLVTLRARDTLATAEDLFEAHAFHHLPVVDEQGHLLGIISKSDLYLLSDRMTLFRAEANPDHNDRFFRSLFAEEVMVRQVVHLAPTATLEAAAALFRQNKFHALPIVDATGRLRGLVTTFALLELACPD